MTASIEPVRGGFDVAPLVAEIAAHPEVWNQHKLRTESYGTPHTQVSDIWVRYNPWRNFNGDAAAFVLEPHESEWYPVAESIPAVVRLIDQVMQEVGGKELGGVLITKVPPGGEVAPHIDQGWHSRYYEKFAVQLLGNQDQVFWFEDCELRPEPGDLYTFDNSKLHAVYNRSDEDRMTLIICIRR
ncbi:MAG TPA: aspartyl/asparaginyl beta-hydroxylase domain-containing protein [Terriglobales bacterium]|nr:aspartyl/asparaginyl beta-hydroxylase domain-containing protein [Terriglobales bacterium]